MTTVFPTSIDTFINPNAAAGDTLASVPHDAQHDNINDAVAALEAKVGINNSAVTTSIDYKLAHNVALLASANTFTAAQTFSNPILASNGSAGSPAYSFSGSIHTGIYTDGSNGIFFSNNSANTWTISGATSAFNSNGGGNIHSGSGTAASPGLSFFSDQTVGIFKVGGLSAIGFATAGVERGRFDASGNLGVGMTPTYLLDVNGTSRFASSYTGQAPSGAMMIYNNSSASGQNILSFQIQNTAKGQIRSDFNGNMSYAAYGSGVHDFYINGDYPTGGIAGQIGVTSFLDGGGFQTDGIGGIIATAVHTPGIYDQITSGVGTVAIGATDGSNSATTFIVDSITNGGQYSFGGSSTLVGDAPLFIDSGNVLQTGSFSGTNRVMATATGTLTNKGLAEWNVNGNLTSTLTPDGNYTFTGTQTYFSTRAIIGNTTDPTGAGFSLVAYTASNVAAAFVSTTTYGAGGGAGMVAIADRGAAVTSGARLGYLFFNGATDSSHTYYYSAGIEGLSTENFSGTTGGSKLVFSTTANGGQVRTNILTLDQDKSATFAGNMTASGNILINTAGKGLSIKSGSNARIGTGTLSGGTLTVANTSVTANTRVFLTDTGTSVTNVGSLTVVTTAGVGFVVTSTIAIDSSTFNWLLIESA